MTVLYGKFEIPEEIEVKDDKANPYFAKFVVSPFEPGYGHTVGSAMRRMMLTSIESPAVIGVRIEGVSHEYTAIDGVIEDMTNIVLNFKNARLRKLSTREDNSRTWMLSSILEINQEAIDAAGGSVKVKLGDLLQEDAFEIINPEQHLFTVTKAMKRRVDLRVGIGRGYVATERLEVNDKLADEILVDACYSPVRLVNYFVENTRVGKDTDFDRLVIEVTTDGRITPREAISHAAEIGIKHFEVFRKLEEQELGFEETEISLTNDRDDVMNKLVQRICDIEFSVRASNCLAGAEIEFISELVVKPESELLKFRNFGKKSLSEIKSKLTEMGFHLGMDLSSFGIDKDNVREVTLSYLEEKAGKGI